MRVPIAKTKSHTSKELIQSFRDAVWYGNETDKPEGARYTQVSETLMEEIICSLNLLETENKALKQSQQ